MEIKFKKLSHKAVMPSKAHKTDAGFDLTTTGITTELNECGQLVIVYHTDLALEIPEGYFALVMPRSSIAKKSLRLTNSCGVIDSGYRGEILGKFIATTDVVPAVYKVDDRFAQLVILPVPDVEFVESDSLSESDRGDGGYGSSDNAQTAVDSDANTSNDSEPVVSEQDRPIMMQGSSNMQGPSAE
jgi:dUTP pyrophosphatase